MSFKNILLRIDFVNQHAVAPFRLDEREEWRLKTAETLVYKSLAKLGQVTAAASDPRRIVEIDGAKVLFGSG